MAVLLPFPAGQPAATASMISDRTEYVIVRVTCIETGALSAYATP
jgi:hypothetical protein